METTRPGCELSAIISAGGTSDRPPLASYSLAYAPTDRASDNRRRRIRVQLSAEIEEREGVVTLLTRRSYVMLENQRPGNDSYQL